MGEVFQPYTLPLAVIAALAGRGSLAVMAGLAGGGLLALADAEYAMRENSPA